MLPFVQHDNPISEEIEGYRGYPVIYDGQTVHVGNEASFHSTLPVHDYEAYDRGEQYHGHVTDGELGWYDWTPKNAEEVRQTLEHNTGQPIAHRDPPEEDDWHEASVNAPEVVEVPGTGTIWHSNDRPYLYHPEGNRLYVGETGAYHADMELPGSADQRRDIITQAMRGRFNDDAVEHYDAYGAYDDEYDHHFDAIERALGQARKEPRWIESAHRHALDYAGDALPAEEPQALSDRGVEPDRHKDWNPVDEYKFVYANGQFHISEDHDHEELFGHAGVPDLNSHGGPMAVGHVHVDMGKATFEVEGNLHAQGLARILKDYCKQVGWRWGGLTDAQGEPIGTGSEFAPVKSMYFVADATNTKDKVKISNRALKPANSGGNAGVIHMGNGLADVRPLLREHFDAFKEFADDHGLQLCSGNDNVLKRIEDLEENNTYTPEWNDEDDHFMFQDPKDERLPGGVYKCPACSRIFHSWGIYLRHRSEEESAGDETPETKDTKWLDMDAPSPPHWHDQPSFTEAAAYDPWQDDPVVRVPEPDSVKFLMERTPFLYHPQVGFWVGHPGDYHSNLYNQGGRGRRGYYFNADRAMANKSRKAGDYTLVDGVDLTIPPEHAQYLEKWIQDDIGVPARYRGLYDTDDTHSEEDWVTSNFVQSAPKVPQGKDMLPAPLPFLYDIEEDAIFVGEPGQRTSDIPGQFTPGGIVEGTYEPGGKVFLRSMTNMPYTVRHMLELWYYQHPEMEVTSVQLEDAEGKRTKLAAQDIGNYIAALVAADATTWKASRALKAAGGRVYVVGGAVRDALLGKEPNDLDLMVTGLPAEEVNKALRDLPGKVDITGKDFGVFRYNQNGGEVEIALPRRERDLKTGPNGRPLPGEADHTMTPEEDLYRRDFTVNAMAVDLDTGHLIDPFNGSEDVAKGTLRTLNTKSLSDDPLRTVRALTAVSKHGLLPDDDTKDQMAENAHLTQYLPAERIRAELDKLFKGDNPGKAIRLAQETGLLQHILPEVDRAHGFDQQNPHHELLLGDHLINVMERAKERKPSDPDFALAGLLHDIGKVDARWTECRDCLHGVDGVETTCPNCGSDNMSGHYYEKRGPDGLILGGDHETIGAAQAYHRLFNKLLYPKARAERIRDLIQHHMFPGFDTERGARRFLNKVGPHADDLLDLRWADQGGKAEYPTDPTLSIDKQRKLVEQAREQKAPTAISQLAINGGDLIAAGMKPGPEMGQTLQRLVTEVVDNPELNTKDGLLGLARGWGLLA